MQTQDLPYLFELLTHPVVGRRFRLRGQTPSPEDFARRLWDGVLAQWIIELRSPPRPLGLVVLTEPDFINGTAFFSMVADPAARHFGILLDGAAAVIDHAFQTWPFRYLYAEVAEESLGQFASGREWLFEEDGRRREALYLDGSMTRTSGGIRSRSSEPPRIILAIAQGDVEEEVRRLVEGLTIQG